MPEAQPTFEDLGQPLGEVTFCVVDLETTGGGPDDTITEFGAVKVRGGEVLGEFQTFVNPGQHIPGMIQKLTGITDSMVADAPALDAVFPTFLAFAEGTVLVAHNARFDIGFLKRAAERLGYPWPSFPVVDTVALARQAMLRDEVPNFKLGTLAAHFGTSVTPSHRALDDARATVDVLHALLERVGSFNVFTLEELGEFTHYVSKERRAKRILADHLPYAPGVYSFVAELPDGKGVPHKQVLYVGKSRNIKNRVRTYFTAAEGRARMDEMVRIATSVQATVCRTELEAEVLELRMIAAFEPRYNRRSKYPQRQHWLKLTEEPFPRFSVVKSPPKDAAAFHFGPIRSRNAIEQLLLALYDTVPIRQCNTRLNATKPSGACALAEMGKCVAPCQLSVSKADYQELLGQAISVLGGDLRPMLSQMGSRISQLAGMQRYEECAELTHRVEACVYSVRRHHRMRSLRECAEIVAARQTDGYGTGPGWELHVIRRGQLVGADFVRVGESPLPAAEALAATASIAEVESAVPKLAEEIERVADWLEQPGVRLISIDGDWAWPLHAGANEPYVMV
jgi:DNA polymerase-3 subunit epsilon